MQAVDFIETDAATLSEWASDVRRCLDEYDDGDRKQKQELIELAVYVDAIIDYTKYVERIERWAEAQNRD